MTGFSIAVLAVLAGAPQFPVEAPRSPMAEAWEAHRDLPWDPAPAVAFLPPIEPAAEGKPSGTVLGWLPYWAFGSATLHLDRLTVLAYFAAAMDGTATLTDMKHWGSPQMAEMISAAHAAGTEVVLTITCFDSVAIHGIVGTQESREKAVDAIVTAVAMGGGDGVNIDFEGVKAADRQGMIEFTKALKKAMDEALGTSHVSLATPAVDWSDAWDYPALAAACDALAFMGYGYHWKGSNPGPVAPLAGSSKWGQHSLAWTIDDYLAAGAPPGKVVMGLPLYGYDWPSLDASVPGTKTANATATVYADCAAKSGWQWDVSSSTPYLAYQSGATWRQLWCEDAASLLAKVGLAAETGIAGVAFWALGYEAALPDPWDAIDAAFPPLPPEPGPEPAPEPGPELVPDPAPEPVPDLPVAEPSSEMLPDPVPESPDPDSVPDPVPEPDPVPDVPVAEPPPEMLPEPVPEPVPEPAPEPDPPIADASTVPEPMPEPAPPPDAAAPARPPGSGSCAASPGASPAGALPAAWLLLACVSASLRAFRSRRG
ncbi:MAG: hypothetical protein FJ087_12865 [Deltaproteobacteria bacterium]|nr:hypothetical protein [Deltaproteobacteria bacterium]